MERQPEKPALVEFRHQRHDPAAQVEERRRLERPVRAEHPNEPDLVDHKVTSATVASADQRDRRGQAIRNEPQTDGGRVRLLRVNRSRTADNGSGRTHDNQPTKPLGPHSGSPFRLRNAPAVEQPRRVPGWVSRTPACASHKMPSLAYPSREEAKPFDDLTAAWSGLIEPAGRWNPPSLPWRTTATDGPRG
jgi:hypothetical protein